MLFVSNALGLNSKHQGRYLLSFHEKALKQNGLKFYKHYILIRNHCLSLIFPPPLTSIIVSYLPVDADD